MTTRASLYQQCKAHGLKGLSKAPKAALETALRMKGIVLTAPAPVATALVVTVAPAPPKASASPGIARRAPVTKVSGGTSYLQAAEVFERLAKQHGLAPVWKLTLDKAVARAGCTRHGPKTISLSQHFLLVADVTTVEATVLHEIAHALVGPGNGHGPVWQAKIRSLGGSDARCCESFSEAPYLLRCPCGHCSVPRHRQVKTMLTKTCLKCKKPLYYEAQ
jgi:predicted SprT family Zn-dependent metalloprotease